MTVTYVKDLKAGKPAHGGKPKDLKVAVRPEKDLEVSWQPDASVSVFQLEVKYFKKGALGLEEPSHHNTIEVEGSTCLAHPEDLDKGQSWSVIVNITASYADGSVSETAQCQVAWDDEQKAEHTEEDLRKRLGQFEKMHLAPLLKAKRRVEIPLLGRQHHGKSSHGNHLQRCLNANLGGCDQLDTAPAGDGEKTVATKNLDIVIGSSKMTFIDMPAFSNMNADSEKRLQWILSGHTPEGTQRKQFGGCALTGKAPQGAIVVVSLLHWRDEPDEMQRYLRKFAEVFKNASWGTVQFPYVVAATHRDEFLKQCQGEDPMKALEQAKNGIKKWALTDHVYAVTNYKRGSMGSAANNQETFEMLAQLLTKAARQETSASCWVRAKAKKVEMRGQCEDCYHGLLKYLRSNQQCQESA